MPEMIEARAKAVVALANWLREQHDRHNFADPVYLVAAALIYCSVGKT